MFIRLTTLVAVDRRAGNKDDRRQRLLPRQCIQQPRWRTQIGITISLVITTARRHDDVEQVDLVGR